MVSKAPDGGVDVRVTISSGEFDGDFVPRLDTVFQAKAKSMQPAEIRDEMLENGTPSPIVKELVEAGGAYIIASTEDCSPPSYARRIEAMRRSVESLPEAGSLQLDFYDRSRLHRWLRQYPSVHVWLRGALGRPLSGWHAFGRWSATPTDADDTLILEEGVTVNVPSAGKNGLTLEEALPVVRHLISSSGKPIRITGLSGVGKSRFVQALFEEGVGEGALDRTSVIYTDIGDQPEPSARAMIDTLLAQDSSLTVVLDNCASDLHNSLSARLRAKTNSLKLITVEYDIREDKPQTTEVVQIEAHGPKIAETLLLRRHPELGQFNAAKIAEFSEGNARLALAIAESAPVDDTLSKLTDEQLFNRLFFQRHDLDAGLKERAEALSLVYSFSVNSDEEGVDELSLLGELCEHSRLEDEFDNSSPEKREEACLKLENRAFKYGETIGATPALLDGFVARLFEQNYAPYRIAFGRGLMSGSVKPRETWLMLLGALRALDIKIFNYGVLSGALDELSKSDRPLVDSCWTRLRQTIC